MASAPRRKWSKELPPDLSDLMNDLIEYADSFIKEFDLTKSGMRQIVEEFKEISDSVREMQEITDVVRTVGAVTGAGGGGLLLLGLLTALLTGGASLAAAAAVGGVTVVATNVTKRLIQNGDAKKVEKLGKQFTEKVEPLKENLEGIKMTCEKLEQKKTEVQAENTLTDMEEFQRIIRRVSDLRKRSGDVLDVAVMVMHNIGNLVKLLLSVFSVSATPKQDRELRESIIQSADRCQSVTDHFDKMKKELKVFRGY